MNLSEPRSTFRVVAYATALIVACSSPWSLGNWPESSTEPVTVLEHPTVEFALAELDPPADSGYQFVAFGDQRALADGEWQAMMAILDSLDTENERLLCMFDTGDIVANGRHDDQFVRLRQILSGAPELPYLVGVGNHEKNNNRSERARQNTARFLGYLDDRFAPERMYYRKKIGPVLFLVLDSSDLVYGDEGNAKDVGVASGSRGEAQMRWLAAELDPSIRDSTSTTIALIHHPFVQSSTRHRKDAAALWAMEYEGRALPDILADGGVDIVLSGHTHTYERFRLRRDDGAEMRVVNLSGRPRPARYAWVRSPRRARDLRGREGDWFESKGWTGLDRWTIEQEDAMVENESNQFGLFTVEANGGILLEVFYLDDDMPGGVRHDPPVRLK